MNGSDSIGDSAIAGDTRWSGSYGVNVDFIARSHCSVAVVKIEDIQASIFKLCSQMRRLKPGGRVVLQDILEKFEFFPIKCRIQRALEIFQMRRSSNVLYLLLKFTHIQDLQIPEPQSPKTSCQ